MTSRRTWRVALTLVVALALVGAACSDSDDSTPSSNGGGAQQATFSFKPLDAGGDLTIAALDNDDIQIGLLFSSQGVIAQKGWVVLDDDKGLQPADNIVPVVRAAKNSPQLAATLKVVSDALTQDELIGMNEKLDIDKADPDDVAADWLAQKGLLAKVQPVSGAGSVVIGSFNFAESQLMANLYADVLRKAGYSPELKLNIGAREVVQPALQNAQLDLVPEYEGTLLEFVNKGAGEASADTQATLTKLQARLQPLGLVALQPAPAQNKNAFVVTKETADTYDLTTISDLAAVSDPLVLGGPHECPTRPFCMLGLENTYGLKFSS